MPLENILQALETEAEHQIAEIEQVAQVEVERIRARAQEEAAAVRQKHVAAIRATLATERVRILNRAKQETLQVVLGTREALIGSALETTARCLTTLSTTEAYPQLLQQLTQEALSIIGPDDRPIIRVRSEDLEVANQIIQELGRSATVEGNLEQDPAAWGCLGGVVVSTADGRIRLDNTLDARLQRVASIYRSQIAKIVIGDLQED
jgi:vacuolar-type H+-ATPase subunit E/Vma4